MLVDSSFLKKELSEKHNLKNTGDILYNSSIPELYELSIKEGRGHIVEGGSLVAYTGVHTGRSPKDRFVVKEPETENSINWGKINQPISPQVFDSLYSKMMSYFEGKRVFVRDLHVCSHPDYRVNIRVINEYAWHNIFANNLFIRPDESELPHKEIGFTVISAPNFKANSDVDGTRTETFILLNLQKRIALIGGTEYAGEMKKSVFTAMNYFLPEKNIFPMHCSANVGEKGDVALFFGLSGTGKQLFLPILKEI